MSDAASAFGFDDADGETPESSDIFRTITGTNAATVLVIVPVEDVVATVDTPMAAIGDENALGVGLIRRRLVIP